MPSFIFTIDASITINTYPVNETGFTGNSWSNIVNGSIRTLTFTWTSFTISGGGLSFNNISYRAHSSLNITQFGGILMHNGGNQFNGFGGSITALDSPILQSSAYRMFNNITSSSLNINHWNTSPVTDMSQMFENAISFNSYIGGWNVGNVTNMNSMFRNARLFNSDISAWNVTNVTNMGYMFLEAYAFSSDIGAWNVTNVTDMSAMLYNTYVFNSDISAWNVAKVTNMLEMFHGTILFNQNLSAWNVGNVQNMNGVFKKAVAFNQNIGSWDFTKVSNITNILDGANLHYTTYSSFIKDLSANTSMATNKIFNNHTLNFYRIDDVATNNAYTYLSSIGINLIDAGSLNETELSLMFNPDFTKIVMDSTVHNLSSNIIDKYTIITDSGDTSGNYLNNESIIHTLNFTKGSTLSVYLISETGIDFLKIANATGTNLLNTSGNNRQVITLNDSGNITVTFTSNGDGNYSGYIIVVKLAASRFAFTINSNIVNDYPFYDDGNFTNIITTNVYNGVNAYDVTIEYDISGTVTNAGGVSFNNKSYASESSINITKIDDILLDNLGSQFKLFAGSITAVGSPIIRSNVSYMFASSTSSILNINEWDVGSVTGNLNWLNQ